MSKILLVDDDTELTDLLSEVLSLSGFNVDIANNGQEALNKLEQDYSLILLDVMMPVLNGIETLKQIRRQSNIPVMMLTARGDDIDRVLGLELGADDYLPKPFNDRELIARIKAILRRSENNSNKVQDRQEMQNNEGWIYFDGLKLNQRYQQTFYKTQEIPLTVSEFSLLEALILSQGEPITREELSMHVLGKSLSPFDRSIDMHMSNLRKKLPPRKDGLPWFKTLRGRGYLLISE
ncbi:response regulator [Rodentibacter trehalosifermentans]|uniref:DNA-binding response regulator n=1 Tax=Rodentibacter trehalosifermentans TaxID=1908263 RepID=A0A1V3IW70_9PAST|nr:response regulator [Rodentibacter trehalosifermentans]OOF46549.1 DNA-binding response regulator [Rodentibacter trehalosifermentans]OOF48326.1 DNA-binding response regulator [Rodentibacter trehalosifermentans]OOF52819.1 DNA-binding response regulator [Rodentibacter trehalosifermentans]